MAIPNPPSTPPSNTRIRGLALTILSTLWISPDALLILLLQENNVPDFTIITYKFAFAFLLQIIFASVYLKGLNNYLDHIKRGQRYVFAGAFFNTVVNITLSLAFMHTTSANALILFSLHVVWSAVLGWYFLNDVLPNRSVGLVLIGVASAIVVFLSSDGNHGDDESTISASDNRVGCILGFIASLAFASLMLTYRSAGKHLPDVEMLPTTSLGSLMTVVVLGVVTRGSSIVDVDGTFENVGLLFLDGGICVGIAMMGYTIGPKMITAAEVTLICLLEPCVSPIFVWIGVGQVPSIVSIITGVVFVCALVAHEVVGMRMSVGGGVGGGGGVKFQVVERL